MAPEKKELSFTYRLKEKNELEFSEEYLKIKTVNSYYKDDELAKSVIRSKYLHPMDKDNLALMWYREAKSLYDIQIKNYKKSSYTLLEMYEALEDFKYIFGGRINYSLGVEGIKGSLNNCYVLPIEHDSLYGIYHSLGANALTYAKGGGVGNDITILRPSNSAVKGTGATSPGATSFMDIISCNTGTIAQHGRRGANLISIHCQHPDVEYFIDNKNDNFYDYIKKIEKYDKNLAKDLNNDFSDRRKTSFSNISVKFTDEFMNAVFSGGKIQLYFPDIDNCPKETDKNLIEKYKTRLVTYFMFYENLSLEQAQLKAKNQMPYSIYDTRWDGDLDGWRKNGHPVKIHRLADAKDIWEKFCQSAWKSAEPGLLFLDTIKRNWTSDKKFLSTNPCQPGFSPILKREGIAKFDDVSIGDMVWSAQGWTKVVNKVSTGIKPVYAYKTKAGVFYGTENHRIVESGEKIEVAKAESMDIIKGDVTSSIKIIPEIVMDGLVIGDGSFHPSSKHNVYLIVGKNDQDYFDSEIKDLLIEPHAVRYENAWKIATSVVIEEMEKIPKRKIPDRYIYADKNIVASFLRGLYSANGSVCGNRVTLKSTCLELIEQAQLMLNSLGISSYYTVNKPSDIQWKNGTYTSKKSYDLNISGDRDIFYSCIGFLQRYKMEKLKNLIDTLQAGKRKSTFDIFEVSYVGDFPVYDITVDNESHTYWSGGINTSNCGEILLSSGEPCNLGHINLVKFIDSGSKRIDIESVKKYVPIFLYMQDLIHDANAGRQSLAVQEEASLEYRRLGCGYTGVGDALIHLKMKYDNPQTISYMEKVASEIEIEKWWASTKIAKEKGHYPKFDYAVFSNSEHFKKMPQDLQDHIKKYGMRNVATSTIAPVGTGSILTQTSSGIEPIFSTHYKRRVKQEDGTYKTFFTYPKIIGDTFGSHKNLPEYVSTAHTVSYKDRVRMQGAFQRWIDNSISSTVNLPKDATVQDVRDVYEEAFRSGLKGVSVYRDGSRSGILITEEDVTVPEGHAAKSPDRLTAMRVIRKFEGRKFYFTVSLNNGNPYEVFLNTNAHSSSTDCDKAVEALEKLLRSHQIEQHLIDDQIQKSQHQANSVRVCRLVSMALRHNVELVKIVKCLMDLDMPVISFIFHLSKVLSEWIPNGTTYGISGSNDWIFQNGCVINIVTGESKC